MSATLTEVRYVVLADDDPDPSYLEQDEFSDRLAAYHAGEFAFVGVRAVAEIAIDLDVYTVTETIESPGLWGIESDSGDDYMREVGRGEAATLRAMLRELCVTIEEYPEPQLVWNW